MDSEIFGEFKVFGANEKMIQRVNRHSFPYFFNVDSGF